jgi:NADH-quinone oxidoreductase subunit G
MNVIDICPVGALTSRHFRFKARVWEMSATETVCPGCSRGCNMYTWVRNNEILRQTPRFNPDVNDYWMCDAGRLNTFPHVNAETRVKSPAVKRDAGLTEVGWDEATAQVVTGFKLFRKSEIAVVGSAYLTNEDAYVLMRFAREVLGSKQVAFMTHVNPHDQDTLLVRADKMPNARGVEEFGMQSGPALEAMARGIREGTIKALLVCEEDLASDSTFHQLLGRLEYLVVTSPNENETTRIADVVLPSSTFAEKNGTFTNFQGRVQRIRPSVATIEQDRALDGFAMARTDKFGSQFDRWARGTRRDARPTWRILAGIASLMGVKFKHNSAEELFNDIAGANEAFRGMSYRKLGSRGLPLAVRKGSAVPA